MLANFCWTNNYQLQIRPGLFPHLAVLLPNRERNFRCCALPTCPLSSRCVVDDRVGELCIGVSPSFREKPAGRCSSGERVPSINKRTRWRDTLLIPRRDPLPPYRICKSVYILWLCPSWVLYIFLDKAPFEFYVIPGTMDDKYPCSFLWRGWGGGPSRLVFGPSPPAPPALVSRPLPLVPLRIYL